MRVVNLNLTKILKKIILIIIVFITIGFLTYIGINSYVNSFAKKYITTTDKVEPVQAVVVLGAHVYKSGNLSPILQDRVDVAIKLYKEGKVKKILMSGDHGQVSYDEVNAMRKYAIKKGVPEEDVFMDHAGFSTYESIYRAKYIFGLDKMIISTQEYHLKRAVYIAKKLGIDATGVSASLRPYAGAEYYEFRESLARCKDFFKSQLKLKPTFLGEKIDITGSGTATKG